MTKVRDDAVGFARIQWETWSPPGWLDETEFSRTAEGFSNPDWVNITANAYRSRWLKGKFGTHGTTRYSGNSGGRALSTPTLMIQGGRISAMRRVNQKGLRRISHGRYQRVLFDGIGHFPHREAPDAVATAIHRHLATR
jgi:pimeloyl-ACP methyl ester carboxylesterase